MPLPPENPENFDKVNYVIDAWSRPCQAPWYIYLETLKPAALEAFIVLISFGWADVVRGRFRPKGLGRRSSKRKGRWARKIPRFPEIGNTLGKAIPIGEQIDDFVKWGTGTKFLWRIDNAMQAGLFFWLVADVAEDFVFNWTSLLYKTYWCRASDLGRFSYQDKGLGPIPNDIWFVANFSFKDYQSGPPYWFSNSGFSGPAGCVAAAALTVEQRLPFDPAGSLQVRIRNDLTGLVYADSDVTQADGGGNASAVLSGDIPPNTSFEVIVRMTGTPWANYGKGVVTAIESE